MATREPARRSRDTVIPALVRAMDAADIRLRSTHAQRPTLDDVFLSLTGGGTAVRSPGTDAVTPISWFALLGARIAWSSWRRSPRNWASQPST